MKPRSPHIFLFETWMSVHVAYLQCCRSPLLFHIFLHTALHADWVTIAVTEWLIDLSGDRGLRRGGEGGCMATGCKWSLQLPRSAFKPPAPPTSFFFQRSLLIIAESHSAAGENKHCFIYTSRAVNEPLWTALLGQRTMRYMRERLFSNSPWRDDARGLSDILISAAALRSAVEPAGFPDFVDIKGVIASLTPVIDGRALLLWMLILRMFAFRASFVQPLRWNTGGLIPL